MSDAEQYWFNTETKQVEQGPQSHYTNRMGPYPSREAAAAALDNRRQAVRGVGRRGRQVGAGPPAGPDRG